MQKTFLRLFVILLFVSSSLLWAAPKKGKAKMEKAKPVGEKPDISQLEPRGVQRGFETKVKLVGVNLTELTEVKFSDEKLTGEVVAGNTNPVEAWLKISPPTDLSRGAYEFSVRNEKGESGKAKLYVDDLPQVREKPSDNVAVLPSLPLTFWGVLNPMADTDEVEFEAKAGRTLVFDLAAKSISSKANVTLSLFDASGTLLAHNNSFDGGDPLLAHKFLKSGKYRLRVSDETLGGSAEHFYRLSIGEFPEVVGAFPLSLTTNANVEVELVGYNLAPKTKVRFKAENPGEVEIPIDAEKFRSRKGFKVLATSGVEGVEQEPNNLPAQANRLNVPGAVNGRIAGAGEGSESDLFQFEGKAGAVLIIETDAARRGSPVDTKIEVLHSDGRPVERVLLQAVRDSHITFRPINSVSPDIRVENWTEMELNEYMYLQGEVAKIFRMPQGPDSGFQFYANAGRRFCYFDTSPTDHANDEPCYVVEPHPPGEKLIANGLPVFPLYYANDDDVERKLGTDSRVQFKVPQDGTYLVRVSDSRGARGERFVYRLVIREAKPDFNVTLNGANPTVPPGSGQEFTFTVDRMDGFEGDISLQISGLPEGVLASNPIVIQAGHFTASGTICVSADAKEINETTKPKISATAKVEGKNVVKEVNAFEKIKLGDAPKLVVAIEPYRDTETNFVNRSISDPPLEITIAPGEVVPAWLKIKRSGHEELVTFTVENLPHGVIVDNIGLSGVLIPKGEDSRQIFLKAAKWVPETDRLVYCQAKQAGNPTSLPILVHVRRHDKNPQISASK